MEEDWMEKMTEINRQRYAMAMQEGQTVLAGEFQRAQSELHAHHGSLISRTEVEHEGSAGQDDTRVE